MWEIHASDRKQTGVSMRCVTVCAPMRASRGDKKKEKRDRIKGRTPSLDAKCQHENTAAGVFCFSWQRNMQPIIINKIARSEIPAASTPHTGFRKHRTASNTAINKYQCNAISIYTRMRENSSDGRDSKYLSGKTQQGVFDARLEATRKKKREKKKQVAHQLVIEPSHT